MTKTPRPFLFVGTAKAGTTSIYNYLLQHPGLFIPKKETFYFLRDIYSNQSLAYPQQRSVEDMILDESDYGALYLDQGERVTGEIGTGYLYHHQVAIPRIKEQFGDEVNIFIILRDPVKRAFSSYNHFVKDLHEESSFEEALELEESRKSAEWDFMWSHRELGCYANQVGAYMEAFSHVEVLLYDDLVQEPQTLMNRVFDKIGVEPVAELDTSKKFNPSGKPKNKTIQRLLIHENPVKKLIRPIVRAVMSDDRRARVRKELKSRNLKAYDSMSEQTAAELRAYYLNDIQLLEGITGLDLSAWK